MTDGSQASLHFVGILFDATAILGACSARSTRRFPFLRPHEDTSGDTFPLLGGLDIFTPSPS